MHKLTHIQLVCVALLALLCAGTAHAYNTLIYASTSKLSTGKWVKITIPESGIYEITYDELSEMGFNNPDQVKVYGTGGYRIDEELNGAPYDDLKRIPMIRRNNKIIFYGKGPIAYSISDYSSLPHFTRIFNPYSQVGCYFLTEDSNTDYAPPQKPEGTATEYVDTYSSLNFFIHENEVFSSGNSGKEMMGEEFTHGQIFIDYKLPGIADSTIVVHTVMSAKANSGEHYVKGVLHSGSATDTTAYTKLYTIYSAPNEYIYYYTASPYGTLKLTDPAEEGQFEPLLSTATSTGAGEDPTVVMKCLDYFIITYKRENVIKADEDNQLLMGYVKTTGNELFKLPNGSSNIEVWNIDNVNIPKQVVTSTYNDATGQGVSFTAPKANLSIYMAFDPSKTLKKISSYEQVENQNLHGMEIPDLLIITTKTFMEQAERIADMHRAIDGIDVAVVDHEKVFNEFSSGTRDAMAYRLLCKMLYDRDTEKNKFKNLLLFGTGSFDNRELMGSHPQDLLTYQSDVSNYQTQSVTTDDFFGYLDDGSGTDISLDRLRIGIGRITCSDVEEAKSDVDKIVEYYATPDYGVWRNNALVFTDTPEGKYMFYGEGYKNTIDEFNLHTNTVHNSMYPRSAVDPSLAISRRYADEANTKLSQFLKDGAYFTAYCGHAGPTTFTQTNNLWTVADVKNTIYPHWPVMSTACCDVAHYDNDSHGIAEQMFHKRNGGAIAMLTSSRMVFATSNDILTRFFINGLFSNTGEGETTTLGEAYMKAKLGITTYDINKLSFFLLGDPAMKFNYPISRFNVTKVNGTSVTSANSTASVSPLSQFEIEAQVVDAEGNLDNTFNGDATLTLYDKEEYFTNLTFKVDNVETSRDIYLNRPKLAEVTGRVTNGVFHGTMMAPKSPLASNEQVLLRTYAHKDNSDYMVNGSTEQIKMLPYDEETAINDGNKPVIDAMYINDASVLSTGAAVGANSILYITATDDYAINVQENQRMGGMMLVLDGGKTTYGDICSYLTVTDDGKTVNIEYPLNQLSEGTHTLTYTVYDLAGNKATKTIPFLVGNEGSAELVADKWPVYRNEEVNFDIETSLARTPDFTIRVTDATGKLVWMTEASSFPVAWDMKDMSGKQVPAGLYRYFGTYNDGSNYGGTSINKLIVLDAVKSSAE